MDRNGKIPIFPNAFPYNELLLSGRLLAKTRNWSWDYRGPVLLYTSSRNVTSAWQSYNMPPRCYPHQRIVGWGTLVDCRPLTDEEWLTLAQQFNPLATNVEIERRKWGLIWPMAFGFFFEDLTRFPTPIEFKWPSGAILPVWRTVEGLHTSTPIIINPNQPQNPEEWVELTQAYIAGLNHMARRKIRLPWHQTDVWAYWDKNEGCFFWNSGENAVYMDEPDVRPTHVRIR